MIAYTGYGGTSHVVWYWFDYIVMVNRTHEEPKLWFREAR